jgi:hypothetical protein
MKKQPAGSPGGSGDLCQPPRVIWPTYRVSIPLRSQTIFDVNLGKEFFDG